MWCPIAVARSWRSAEMSIGATTIRSPGPGDASASRRPSKSTTWTAARPRVRRVVPQARALVRGDHVRHVLDRARAIDERPPVHRLGRAPRIHVRRNANEHFGAVRGQLPDRLRKQPVVADGAADAADRRVGDRKQRLVVARQVVRAAVHLVRNPGIHLPVLVQDALGPDEARRVEHDARPARILLEHRAALDVDVVLARFRRQPIGVLVRDRHGQLVEQLAAPSGTPARRARTRETRRAGPAGTARCPRPPNRSCSSIRSVFARI